MKNAKGFGQITCIQMVDQGIYTLETTKRKFAMANREEILKVMRDYFSRPSAVHHNPEFTILWVGSTPLCHVTEIHDLRKNDTMLLEIFHEAVRRDSDTPTINWFGEDD